MRCWPLAGLLLLLVGTPVRAEVPLSAEGVDERLMVVFRLGVPEDAQRAVAGAHGLEILRVYRPINALVVRTDAQVLVQAETALRAEDSVLMVGRDEYRKWIDAAPSFQETPLPSLRAVMRLLPKLPPGIGKNQEVQWGVRRVNAPAAWPTNRGSGVKVAIIDTGIDPTHPELAARVKGGYNAIDKDKPWHDDHSHGTHVAGITAATLNGSGVVGVAPEADLYAVKVLTKEGSGSIFGILGGMMWCVENGMQIANMSLGAPQGNSIFEYAVNMLVGGGVTLVAAAGNDGGAVNFPAAYPAAIAVSALCPKEGDPNPKLCSGSPLATFSSRGPEVDLIAPGVKIPSTVLGGEIKAYSGTSMATPHVTGLAALAAAGGATGPDAVRAALTKAAVAIPGVPPTGQGSGLVDAGKLVR